MTDHIERLEDELRRTFQEAQREADAMFAQYQLSQLLASGGQLADLSQAVVAEIVRLCSAAAGALWLAETGGRRFRLVTATSDAPVRDCGEASSKTREEVADSAAVVVSLGDEPPDGIIALWPGTASTLDREGLRVVQLSRHELAVAFRGAQLRQTLEHERQELTAIVDGATDAIVQVDQDCRVVRINPAAYQMLGAARGAIGQLCHEVLRCAEAGAHGVDACPLAEVIQSGRPIPYREASVLDAHSNMIFVAGGYSRAAGEFYPHPGGRIRATAILRDISAIRALEQLREGFVATVSHELRTPLALIRGYTDTLLHLKLEPGEQRQYLERIDHATERLSTLVKEILDIAHLQADPLVLQRAPVPFSSLVARLRGDLTATGQDGRIVAMVPSDLPPVAVDSGRIGQVLENLVGNALKYSTAETHVTIGAFASDAWLTVLVEDEGVGIPESDRTLVLEPFHRAPNVRESSIQGTGLGLYISRRLVEAHSGRLWVGDRSDGRPGTRVTFTLPLVK